jgi:hypothetical protein
MQRVFAIPVAVLILTAASGNAPAAPVAPLYAGLTTNLGISTDVAWQRCWRDDRGRLRCRRCWRDGWGGERCGSAWR